MDLLVSYQKIHSELICRKFGDDTWSLFTYYIEVDSFFFFKKKQCFGIVFSSGFAVFYMNNTSFLTKVTKPDSFKVGKFPSLSWL